MVSIASPTLSLDYNSDGEANVRATNEDADHRLTDATRTLSLDSSPYLDYEYLDDRRPLAASPDPGRTRRRRRQRRSERQLEDLEHAPEFSYETIADGDAFRVAILEPGTGPIVSCRLIWQDSKRPQVSYCCLSYVWGSKDRTANIFLEDHKFAVTQNLLRALQSIRDPKDSIKIWVDQICIDQNTDQERSHQVSIMKLIFNQSRKVYVWLGDAGTSTQQLFAFARTITPTEDNLRTPSRNPFNQFGQRAIRIAFEDLLQRPWFERVWVIPEVALSKYTRVVCGPHRMTWHDLVKLVRYMQVHLPTRPGFAKQESLLGNRRQRIAIINQMIASQKESKDHTDLAQLLILAKSSKSSEPLDMVYAFQGLTNLTTFPDYSRGPVSLFGDTVQMYASSIQWVDSYARCHDLSEEHKTFQLMSIVYSAGELNQLLSLPSFVPDWTCPWRLAPVWCKTDPNFTASTSSRDEWSLGIRTEYRAGGERCEEFEVLSRPGGRHVLRITALVFDEVVLVSEHPTPETSQILSTSPAFEEPESPDSSLEYGRHHFTTLQDHKGLATAGISAGDKVAILPGGDVPVIIRSCQGGSGNGKYKAYTLLCECYVQSPAVMYGEVMRNEWTKCEDIIII